MPTETETIPELEWLSACCGRSYVGELSDPVLPRGSADSYCTGECARCHDHTTFHLEDTNET